MATQTRQGPGFTAADESGDAPTGGPPPARESPPFELGFRAYPVRIRRADSDALLGERGEGAKPVGTASALTARETEVLALVAEGYSNKAIGFRLGISERTVKSHLTYVMAKLRTSDRTHSVVTAVRLGWLDL